MKNETVVFDTSSKSKQSKISSGPLRADDPHGEFSFQERSASSGQPFVSDPFLGRQFELANAPKSGPPVSNSQAYSSQQNSPNNRNSQRNKQTHSQFNATNQTGPFESKRIAVSSIPPLTRIGSDSSSGRSSSGSLSKRKPVGNLTPTKFEYLTNGREAINFSPQSAGPQQPRHSSQLDLQRPDGTDPSNDLDRSNGLDPSNGAYNAPSKVQNHLLHSIRSPNLSPLNSPGSSASSNEDSSNRSSPDLANQRSHHLTAYLSKHNAFGKSPDYSSSNHLFDSIQHLDIQKLISNDKRKLFCSTSTLPTISCSNSTLIPKNAK